VGEGLGGPNSDDWKKSLALSKNRGFGVYSINTNTPFSSQPILHTGIYGAMLISPRGVPQR
jgi:hypothetical protein